MYCKILNVKSLDEVSVKDLMDALNNFSVLERIAYKKANQMGKNKDFVQLKGQKIQIEMETFAGKEIQRNGKLSFNCLHYSVTESSGYIEVIIQKHVDEEINFGIRTVPGNALPKDDYDPIDEVMTMKRTEQIRSVQIRIHDDDIWEPDKDFYVELYDPNEETKPRLEGDDTRTIVTIIDEDNPGIIGFDNREI